MASYWTHVNTAILATGHSSSQSSGLPILTVFGIVGTTIGIIAAVQQFLSAYNRRKYKTAEEKFLEAIEASQTISSSLSQVKQYQALRERLRNEIETQIPKQARNAYLVNRLEQLTDDLHRTYADYEDVRRELGGGSMANELDRRVRDAIRMSAPSRRIRERRNLYMLSLIVILIVFNISPLGLNNYFNILGYSDSYTIPSLVLAMALGTLVVTLIFLVAFSFIPRDSAILAWFRSRPRAVQAEAFSLPVLFFVLAIALGYFGRSRAIGIDLYPFSGSLGAWETYAGVGFNGAVIILSVALAAVITSRQGNWRTPGSEKTG